MPSIAIWFAAALALLGHAVLWTEMVSRLHGLGWPRKIIKSITRACVVIFAALPIVLVWHWIAAGPTSATWGERLVSRSPAALYFWLSAAIGVLALFVKPWQEYQRRGHGVLVDSRQELRIPARAIGSSPLVGQTGKFLSRIPGNQATSILAIDRKRLVVPRLPVELEGLTIAHLSDLHITGSISREYFAFVADQVNNLRPDVIAITGDIVENEECLPWLGDTLGRMCAPLGVYFILGNHDAFIDHRQTSKLLNKAGFTSLSGRWLRAEWNDVPVLLGGNELPWIPRAPDASEAPPRDSGKSSFRLVLSHSPDQFEWCRLADADLALAGHTHGGQIQLPLLGVIISPSLAGTRYACGVFRRGNTVMHVTRGVASETLFRFRCPPEIALLELTGNTPE